ncbi:hypothetical protein [Nonomuraea salmonea]|uniref:hypothetical protein n=1 Tax=Nonomuraea salmonea TaxID=46181 RepID=UPI0031F12A79
MPIIRATTTAADATPCWSGRLTLSTADDTGAITKPSPRPASASVRSTVRPAPARSSGHRLISAYPAAAGIMPAIATARSPSRRASSPPRNAATVSAARNLASTSDAPSSSVPSRVWAVIGTNTMVTSNAAPARKLTARVASSGPLRAPVRSINRTGDRTSHHTNPAPTTTLATISGTPQGGRTAAAGSGL